MAAKTENNGIILFPDFQALKDEVERMKTELSMLLSERDELQFVVAKNINARYMLELGSLEYKAYKAYLIEFLGIVQDYHYLDTL